ncbi:anti-sigma factor antagonist [Neobacillus dielmonensis]|uniref:anti-sigma factor antagonist n=1 Tax=Neobacillus dielmonensis TaxID=1347369 RepID=UPI0005AA7478|nr:anti-sigma factor antagonist [Neobacillus dielmonensis]
MNLAIDVQQKNQEIWVQVAGEIDAFTAPKLREELSPYAEGDMASVIVIDLKNVSYLDSTGLGVFVGLFKQLKQKDGELRLVNLSNRVQRLFEITGLSHIMNISANV